MRILYYDHEDADLEAGIAASRQDWAQVLLDLEEMQRQIKYYQGIANRYADRDDNGDYGLEPGTEKLIEKIRELI